MSYSFKGYQRNDGTVGTRNYVGIVSSVICSSAVVREISESVPNTIPIVHANGCAQLGDDFELTRNMLVGVASNPNIHSNLLVGLGCETNQVEGMLKIIPRTKPIEGIGIQQLFGGVNTINKGVSIAKKWAEESSKESRTETSLSGLTIGILNADADERSLSRVAPTIGKLVDTLVEQNAKVIMGVSKNLEPVQSSLVERIIKYSKEENINELSKGLSRLRWKEPTDLSEQSEFSSEQMRAGNYEMMMTGSKNIQEILSYGYTPEEEGLYLMTVTTNIVESLSKMAASGCNIALLVSAEGVFSGSVAFPCMTITGQTNDDIFDDVVDYKVESNYVEKESEAILQKLLEICSGEKTQLEELELGEFSIPHLGTTY